MDFKDSIEKVAERIEKLKGSLCTEEATKNALIMPFISALGYDVFNPLEVIPEYTCDIGIKKGEKIDYAIMHDGEPSILIECKHWEQDLNLHDNQLIRYFNVSPAKFGVLTNGIVYRFYTDIEAPNKMDDKPFLEINLLDLKDVHIEELKKFHKSYYNTDTILSSASELKYMMALKSIIAQEFSNPSTEFVKVLGKKVHRGTFSQNMVDYFGGLIKKTISIYVNDLITNRLKVAIDNEGKEKEEAQEPAIEENKQERHIETTEVELEAYYIIKGILRPVIDADRVVYRDAISYFTIIADDNNRKLICRLYLNNPDNLRVVYFDENNKEIRHTISSLTDLYSLSQELQEIAKRFV